MDDEKIIKIMQAAADTGDFASGCDKLKALIASYSREGRIDENMQTRILAKLAYAQGGKTLDTAKLIEVLDGREAELKNLSEVDK